MPKQLKTVSDSKRKRRQLGTARSLPEFANMGIVSNTALKKTSNQSMPKSPVLAEILRNKDKPQIAQFDFTSQSPQIKMKPVITKETRQKQESNLKATPKIRRKANIRTRTTYTPSNQNPKIKTPVLGDPKNHKAEVGDFRHEDGTLGPVDRLRKLGALPVKTGNGGGAVKVKVVKRHRVSSTKASDGSGSVEVSNSNTQNISDSKSNSTNTNQEKIPSLTMNRRSSAEFRFIHNQVPTDRSSLENNSNSEALKVSVDRTISRDNKNESRSKNGKPSDEGEEVEKISNNSTSSSRRRPSQKEDKIHSFVNDDPNASVVLHLDSEETESSMGTTTLEYFDELESSGTELSNVFESVSTVRIRKHTFYMYDNQSMKDDRYDYSDIKLMAQQGDISAQLDDSEFAPSFRNFMFVGDSHLMTTPATEEDTFCRVVNSIERQGL
eukprot:CAMPEP_0115002506 /NCGR_PEP_ID=MMETSP0216-20121206/18043_1 /TAXON_ID=223996 /ORGANISM="Protocruzia adherens, Strain Boccale" /LENGTH=438 /DNA_ID=CAMNT_0002368107 /DNA_START=511 /DNA_END=1828 /DNA_ORIENTATION=+